MSLVRDRYWIDPKGLDATRLELRASLFRGLVREVVAGTDGRATIAALRECARAENGEDPEECVARADEAADLLGSELPGTFSVVSESWQGHDRTDFHVTAVYVHEDTVCLLGDGLHTVTAIAERAGYVLSVVGAELRALARMGFVVNYAGTYRLARVPT